ncbi:hypothetical protein NL529_32650, partial [Klebsiella pneumoniae]|nr:hypothetical protein [Klebsiella pneumoniae]
GVNAIRIARDFHLLPEAYLFGNWHVFHYAQARRAFLNGQIGSNGWPSFFPYAWLVKTPLGTLAMLLLTAAAAFSVRRNVRAP